MPTRRQLLVVAHHRHSCGGLLPGLLSRYGDIAWAHPLEGGRFPDAGSVDGVVVLGSHYGVHDPVEGLDAEKRFLEQALQRNVPLLGVCFGAQLIALLHGATVQRGARGEYGSTRLQPAGHPLLTQAMDVMQWHHDGIHQLPAHAQRIARGSGEYPEQAFLIGNAVGLQFHPETTTQMLSRWLARDGNKAYPLPDEALFQALGDMQPMRDWLGGVVAGLFGQD